MRERLDAERGAVFVEFLIVFLVFLTIILGIAQLALIYVGKAVTQRSANAAVRAAVVILDDDPRCYGGAPRNVATGERLEQIELAATIPLMSLSAYEGTVHRAIGHGLEGVGASFAYAQDATLVSFPGGASFGRESDVTVRVEHNFKCGVPLGRLVLCGADRRIRLRAQATLPNQGAGYHYEGPPTCARGL
jgi:hypothetical protein